MSQLLKTSEAGNLTPESGLSARLRNRSARVSIMARAMWGSPLTAELARAGFHVTGLDTDSDRIAALNAGHLYTPDVESRELTELVQGGRYAAMADNAVLAESNVVII